VHRPTERLSYKIRSKTYPHYQHFIALLVSLVFFSCSEFSHEADLFYPKLFICGNFLLVEKEFKIDYFRLGSLAREPGTGLMGLWLWRKNMISCFTDSFLLISFY